MFQINDSDIQACDNMYNATFSSEPFKLGTVEKWESEIQSLKIEYAMKQWELSGNRLPQKPGYGAEDYEFDSYYWVLEDIQEEALEKFPIEINEDTLVCESCNYKGEGEGLMLFDSSLPIFKSKSESFYQVNM